MNYVLISLIYLSAKHLIMDTCIVMINGWLMMILHVLLGHSLFSVKYYVLYYVDKWESFWYSNRSVSRREEKGYIRMRKYISTSCHNMSSDNFVRLRNGPIWQPSIRQVSKAFFSLPPQQLSLSDFREWDSFCCNNHGLSALVMLLMKWPVFASIQQLWIPWKDCSRLIHITFVPFLKVWPFLMLVDRSTNLFKFELL